MSATRPRGAKAVEKNSAPRTRRPKITLKPTDAIFNSLPVAVEPTKVVETFDQFIASLPYSADYCDDIYRGVRAVRARVVNPRPDMLGLTDPKVVRIHVSNALTPQAGDILAWPVHGKVLKPVLTIVRTSVELRRALAKCGKEIILPTMTPRNSGYIEAVAHLPKRGESIVIRVPAALFEALPLKLQERVYARDLRNRLLGQFVVQWQPTDPVMLRPLSTLDRRRIVSLNSPSDIPAGLPQMVPPPPPPSGQMSTTTRYLSFRQPSSWVSDPNAPEHDLMKWDLTLFDVASDFGLKAAFRIMENTAKQYGWAATLANPHTHEGFARWRLRKEREVILTLTRLFPALKKHAKRMSDVLNLSASLFGTAKKASESAKASTDRVADPR